MVQIIALTDDKKDGFEPLLPVPRQDIFLGIITTHHPHRHRASQRVGRFKDHNHGQQERQSNKNVWPPKRASITQTKAEALHLPP